MKTLRTLLASATLLTLAAPAWALSPVGIWTTIDDHTKKPKAHVQLWLDGDKLSGKIIELLDPTAMTVSSPNCPGDKKNKPMVGLTVVWDLKERGDEWNGGTIMDPANGQTYSCILKLADNGKRLNVRGYIFNPLIGRTQTWLKDE